MSILPDNTTTVNPARPVLGMPVDDWVRHQLGTYAATVFDADDVIELRLIPPGRQLWTTAAELVSLALSLIDANVTGSNIYIGANPRLHDGGAKAAEVALSRNFFSDLDNTTLRAAEERWQAAKLPTPTMVIMSGNGIHTYLRLAEPLFELGTWSEMQRDVIALLASDRKIHDPPRLMRAPGFRNWKRTPFPDCRVLFADPTRRYRLAELRAIVPPTPVMISRRQASTEQPTARRKRLSLRVQVLGERIRRYLERVPGAVSGARGHDRTFYAACVLILGFNLTISEAWPFFLEWNKTCEPPWSDPELEHKLKDADAQPGPRGYLIRGRRHDQEVRS